jgi:hypothetical protein
VATTPFTIDFTSPAAPSNLVVANTLMARDNLNSPTAHTLTWTPVTTAPENLDGVEIWTIDAYDQKRIARFSDPAITSYIYPHPRANIPVQYQIHELVRSGGNTLTGLWASTTITLPMRTLTLVSTLNPTAHRIAVDAWTDFVEDLTQTQEWQIPAGGQDYFEIAGSLRGSDGSTTLQIFDREDGSGVTGAQLLDDFKTLFRIIPPETISLRDPRGNKWFGRFSGNARITYLKKTNRTSIDIGFRQTNFVEGS